MKTPQAKPMLPREHVNQTMLMATHDYQGNISTQSPSPKSNVPSGFKKLTNLDLKPVVSGASTGSQLSSGRDMWKKIESQVNAYAEQINQDITRGATDTRAPQNHR